MITFIFDSYVIHCSDITGKDGCYALNGHTFIKLRYFTFIGPFSQLFVVRRLLHQVQDGFGERGVCQRIGFRIHFSFSLGKKGGQRYQQDTQPHKVNQTTLIIWST